jgi:hypothetical protein
MEDDISNMKSKKKVERIRTKNSSDKKAVDIKDEKKGRTLISVERTVAM